MSLCEVCRINPAAWVEACKNGRLLCGKECQLAPIGVFAEGVPRNILVSQLVWLDPVSLARERQANKRIRDIIDNDDDFFYQWLRHFPRPLTNEEKAGWKKFIDGMHRKWPVNLRKFAQWSIGIVTFFEFTEKDYIDALEYKVFVPTTSHFLSAVSRGLIGVVRSLVNKPGILREGALTAAALNGQIEIVRLLLATPGVDPSEDSNAPIVAAAHNGHLAIMRLLMSAGANPLANNSQAIYKAAHNGHLNVVRFLLDIPGADPAAYNNRAIIDAADRGYFEIVQLLIKTPGVDPAALENEAFKSAVRNGHSEIVQLLLNTPGVDPTAGENFAIHAAARQRNYPMVRLLLTDARIRTPEVLQAMRHHYYRDQEILRIIQTLSSEEERKRPRFVERRAY